MTKFHRSATYLQTIENTRILLNKITKLDIQYNTIGANNTSIRSFIHNRLPILRYHNPTLQCTVSINKLKDQPVPAQITVSGTNNTNSIVSGEQYRTCSDILKQILSIDGQSDLIPATQHIHTDILQPVDSNNNEISTKEFLESVKSVAGAAQTTQQAKE